MKRVVIIGAGPCGLVALKEMREAGHEAILFEKSSKLGGVFATSTVYPNLHLTISNWAMAFSDFPDPERLRYSTAQEYLRYLQLYARHFGLERYITYDAEVTSARTSNEIWHLEVHKRLKPQTISHIEADALVVATGANQVANKIPDGLADFIGGVMHSSQYDEGFKQEVAAKKLRVLVVGGGESGADISAELGELSPNVTVWMRRAACVGPRYLNRVGEMQQIEANKTQDFPANGFLEAATTNRMSAAQNVLQVSCFDRFESERQTRPVSNPKERSVYREIKREANIVLCHSMHTVSFAESYGSAFLMNDQATYVTKNQRMCEALQQGSIEVLVSPTISTSGRICEFRTNDHLKLHREFDVILLCSGFHAEFPWLKLKNFNADPRSWFLHCFPEGLGRCLFFLGYARPHQGGIPAMAEMLARYIALLLRGNRVLPRDYTDQARCDAIAEQEYYHLSPKLQAALCAAFRAAHHPAYAWSFFSEGLGRLGATQPTHFHRLKQNHTEASWDLEGIHSMAAGPVNSRFWLRFQVHSDGLTPPASSVRTSFPQFPQLPTELRLQIWKYLLLPRIILVTCQDHDSKMELDLELRSRPSRRLVPAMLHVNHEARSVALEHYEIAFGWKVPTVLADLDIQPFSQNHNDEPLGLATPQWTEPHIYFNFAQDALFLLGELEPCTATGFNSPLTYFLDREETKRVRKVAVAFRALRHGESGSQQVFGTLFHVVDRIKPPNGRILICVNEGDELTHTLMGGEAPLVPGGMDYATRRRLSRVRQSEPNDIVIGSIGRLSLDDEVDRREILERYQRHDATPQTQEENIIQQIWRNWYRGSIVTSSLANMKFWLIREGELEGYIKEDA
ncbi:hypothetical protein SCUP515_07923 [Seiridium cupressi]